MPPKHRRKKEKTKADEYLYQDYMKALRKWLKEVFLEMDALKERIEVLEETVRLISEKSESNKSDEK